MKSSTIVMTIAVLLASCAWAVALLINSALISIDPIAPLNESLVELLPPQEADNNNNNNNNGDHNTTLPGSIIPLLPFNAFLLEDLPIHVPEDPTLEVQALKNVKDEEQLVSTQPLLTDALSPAIVDILPFELTKGQLGQNEPKVISINNPVLPFDPYFWSKTLPDTKKDEGPATVSIEPVIIISIGPLTPVNK
ncbi:hypothetical protein EMPS_11385 [Entomortierella parvispora]|uniref:Uncharacterized protein n=1 Tax=Entomortierella parvispora TaxID=205924 RepID=A0A9P3HLZ1_9FUNG|nr:hypothetical protein EMPS_11385 [Entomortierella parvispora]